MHPLRYPGQLGRTRRKSAFRADRNGTDQTGIADSTPTKVAFNTKVYDRVGDYDAVTNFRYLPRPGMVVLHAQIQWTNSAVNDLAILDIRKNGTVIGRRQLTVNVVGFMVDVSIEDVANGTDFYEAFANLQHGSGTQTISGSTVLSFFTGHQP